MPDSLRLAYLVTVRTTVIARSTPPPTPVTPMGNVPKTALGATLTVMVDDPDPGAGIVLGFNETLTPGGRLPTDKVTGLSKPTSALDVSDVEPCFPRATVSDGGKWNWGIAPSDIPKKAIGVASPVGRLAPITTTRRGPLRFNGTLTLLAGHAALDQFLPAASKKNPALVRPLAIVASTVLPSRNWISHPLQH